MNIDKIVADKFDRTKNPPLLEQIVVKLLKFVDINGKKALVYEQANINYFEIRISACRHFGSCDVLWLPLLSPTSFPGALFFSSLGTRLYYLYYPFGKPL